MRTRLGTLSTWLCRLGGVAGSDAGRKGGGGCAPCSCILLLLWSPVRVIEAKVTEVLLRASEATVEVHRLLGPPEAGPEVQPSVHSPQGAEAASGGYADSDVSLGPLCWALWVWSSVWSARPMDKGWALCSEELGEGVV